MKAYKIPYAHTNWHMTAHKSVKKLRKFDRDCSIPIKLIGKLCHLKTIFFAILNDWNGWFY